MILQFIDENSLLTLKENLPQIINNFSLDSNEWIAKYLSKDPFSNTQFENIEDFSLDMSEEKPFMTEAKNVRLIYNHFKFLSRSQASDERLWAGLCLGPFWNYVQYRWHIKEKCTENNVRQHYFFEYNGRRALTRNALARLWWIGELTYDADSTNPYQLTDFICQNSDFIMHILERNTSNNFLILKAFLKAVSYAKNEEHLEINTDTMGELSKYLNLLGGIYILDYLPANLIYEKILDKVHNIAQ